MIFCDGFSICLFCINIYYFFNTLEKNAKNHKNGTQSMLFISFCITLYGDYGTVFTMVLKATFITLLLLPYFLVVKPRSAEKYQKSAWCHIVISLLETAYFSCKQNRETRCIDVKT